jgi:uncharacterized protein YciI
MRVPMAFLYRLKPPRPNFAQDMSASEADVMERHVAYWQDLLNRDVAVAFGPVLHPEDPRGLGLLDLDDENAARAIGDGDPAVASGTCTYEVLPMDLMSAAELSESEARANLASSDIISAPIRLPRP